MSQKRVYCQLLFAFIFILAMVASMGPAQVVPVQAASNAAPLLQTYNCPCSIWSPTDIPATQTVEALPVELGVKFRAEVGGYITAIRFYKSTGNTGPHYGHLWTNDGTLLGEVLFTNESATGWQEAVLPTPVAITANTTYIATYHTPSGKWSFTSNYFSTQVDNIPLHALANGAELPGNGVYKYGSNGSFPTESYGSTNYWVDVVFNETIGPDVTPPTIVDVVPDNAATGVAINTNITARFSEAMNPGTITPSNLVLKDAGNNPVPVTVSYTAGNYTATLNPEANLAYSSVYTATIKGGDTGVADLANIRMALDYTWTFTTAAPPPPPPDEGPGGPILVIADAGNPFGRYYAEILRNEGLNEFTVSDLALVTPAILENYDLVVLAELSRVLTAGEVSMLTDWVTAGGNLIAMRPDPQLAPLLGLTRTSGTLPAPAQLYAYMKIDTTTMPGLGLVEETIQYHGLADLYALNGASAIAALYSNATTPTTSPAVSIKTVGSSGGEAAAFTYDLARSVVYTRQGNPAWAGQNRDIYDPSVSRIIAHDLYFGNASWDPQPDYIDWNKITIPQADEQMRLLAHLIQYMNRDKKPLPHFWYFPRGEKAIVIMTGDDHGSGNTAGRFDHYKAISPVGCSVQNWECIRSSSYLLNGANMTDIAAAGYTVDGFEIGLHVNTGCVDWTPTSLADFYQSQLASFHSAFPSLPNQLSERTHCVNWTDWASQPIVQLTNGIRLDTNYYYYPPAWVQERPGMFTGSGMVMRFADLDGTLINVYQAVTQMTDESSLQGYGYFNPLQINTLLGNAVGPNGYYGAFTANMHTDTVDHAGSTTIINAAIANGVPVVSGKQMVEWLDGRNNSSFQNITLSNGVLSFGINVAAGANGLQTLVPYSSSSGAVSTIMRDDTPVTFTREIIKGIEYVIFNASAGSYQVTYTPDTTAPVITNVTAVPNLNGTAIIEWVTDEASSTRVDYGTDPDSLNLTFNNAALVTAHSATLTGLANNVRYYYRVRSTDLSANMSVFPIHQDPPASFIVPSAALVDTTFAHFSAGRLLTGVYISNDDDGEVRLAPAIASEFNGSGLPAGWFTAQYPATGAGGTAVVGGGLLTINGARVGTDDTYVPGHSLEFLATFSGGPHQHIGFGIDFNAGPWAIFSTNETGNSFLARTNSSSTLEPIETATPLTGDWSGTAHRFRIEWRADRVLYFVDGVQVANHSVVITQEMRPMAAAYLVTNLSINVDWMRLSPYQTSGTFESRIFDALGTATWGAPAWTANVPQNTTMSLSVRTGNTPLPDATWSVFTPLSHGVSIDQASRYLQYRLAMQTSDSLLTPKLLDIMFGYYNVQPDLTPPAISSRSPASNAIGVPINTNIAATFDEAMDLATINATNFRLRLVGGSQDEVAAITYLDRVVILNPNVDLLPARSYQVTVSGNVKDLSGNLLGSDVVWTFATLATGSFTDTTEADFTAGTPGVGTYLAKTLNGEVILKPVVGEEFSGSSLPANWYLAAYGADGTATVSNGQLVVDGKKVGPNDMFTSGRWLEFVGTFTAGPYKHVGFGVTYENPPWAIFSTDSTNGSSLQARSSNENVPPTLIDHTLSATWNGVSHRYRIEWNATSIDFFVDGTLVDSHTNSISASMRPLAADHNAGGGTLTIDWLRMGPYALSGTYTSRIFDAGQIVDWVDLTATTTIPAGTTLTFETQTSLDGNNWTAWQPVNSPIASPNGRYLRYQANFATNDSNITATLEDVTITYNITPTNVVVSSFTAQKQDDSILVGWQTISEVDLISFNLYRSETPIRSSKHINLTPILVVSPGAFVGNPYEYVDENIEAGNTYYYWLEIVKLNEKILIGPVSAGGYTIFIPMIKG